MADADPFHRVVDHLRPWRSSSRWRRLFFAPIMLRKVGMLIPNASVISGSRLPAFRICAARWANRVRSGSGIGPRGLWGLAM
jgi:hypothetical protein